MANALKKINQRANALQKRHPGAKRKTLLKQAGREWKQGKLSGRKRRKAHAPKKRHTKRHTARRVGKTKTVRPKHKFVYYNSKTGKQKKLKKVVAVGTAKRRKKRYVKAKKIVHCRRVGAARRNSTLKTVLTVGAVVGVGYLLLKALKPSPPPFIPTTNPVVNSSANNILSYATAANLGVQALTALVAKLNSSSPAAIQQANLQLQSTGALPSDWQAVIASGATTTQMTQGQLLND